MIRATLRYLSYAAGALVLIATVAVLLIQRFADGPVAFLQGGPFSSGELVSGPVDDWSFADGEMVEFELVGYGTSRTAGYIVHDGQAYMTCDLGYMWNRFEGQQRWILNLIYVFKTLASGCGGRWSGADPPRRQTLSDRVCPRAGPCARGCTARPTRGSRPAVDCARRAWAATAGRTERHLVFPDGPASLRRNQFSEFRLASGFGRSSTLRRRPSSKRRTRRNLLLPSSYTHSVTCASTPGT